MKMVEVRCRLRLSS